MEELRGAYEGLEGHFPDDDSRGKYRSAMLTRSAEQADFLEPLLADGSVLEIGCGNGRLLIELAMRGSLRRGMGVDVARSRIEFAATWALDLKLDWLEFAAIDAFELEVADGEFDAVLCITGAFGYFDPLREGAAELLASRWAHAVSPGGLLVLELYPHLDAVRLLHAAGEPLRVWRELEADDPWRFYLSEMRLDGSTLVHDKTFIHRTSNEVDAGRRERLRLYSEADIHTLLTSAGWTGIKCHEGWSGARYAGGESMVVTAGRSTHP